MRTNQFQLTNIDTDSISFCKKDGDHFTKQEIKELIKDLNSNYEGLIEFSDDGYYPVFIVLKSKNYIMVDEQGKRKIKGSALKSSTLEPALKQLLNEFIDALVEDRQKDLLTIYNKYVKIVMSGISDIKPWAKKMQLSPTTFNSTRKNETLVVDAIKGTEYKSGDRVYVYRTSDGSLKLSERFANDYCIDTYLEKVYKTVLRFETILPVKEMFKNYALKRNKKELEMLINETVPTSF